MTNKENVARPRRRTRVHIWRTNGALLAGVGAAFPWGAEIIHGTHPLGRHFFRTHKAALEWATSQLRRYYVRPENHDRGNARGHAFPPTGTAAQPSIKIGDIIEGPRDADSLPEGLFIDTETGEIAAVCDGVGGESIVEYTTGWRTEFSLRPGQWERIR